MNVVTTLPWGRPLVEADVGTHPFGDAIVTVVDGSLVVTTAGGFTHADLGAFADDGHRDELLDGALLVTPSYSVVDPDVTWWRARGLHGGGYVEVAEVAEVHADDTWTAERPFPVDLRPVELVLRRNTAETRVP